MTLQSVEASLPEEDITEFKEILSAYGSLLPEYNERLQALGEEKKRQYIEWKKAQDHEMIVKHRSDPVMLTAFKKATQPPGEILQALAENPTVTAESSASPAKPKKKRCTIL